MERRNLGIGDWVQGEWSGWDDGGRARNGVKGRAKLAPALPTPNTQTHTHRSVCLSVWDLCPNRFCPVCKYLWGPQAEVGCSESFSPSPSPILA